jgi:AcrR family transcriptional regulator
MGKNPDKKTADLIMNIAFRLFVEKGYEATNLREIGTEVGINASTIYFYYPSKKKLFFDVLHSVHKTHLELLREKASEIPCTSDKEGMRQMFIKEIELVHLDSASYKLLLRYRLFPVMELANEIREINEKYDGEEYQIWEPYLSGCFDRAEAENRLLYEGIKKLMDGIINEMLISGQAIRTQTLEKWWELYKDIIVGFFSENIMR